jgi:hypothetical protein
MFNLSSYLDRIRSVISKGEGERQALVDSIFLIVGHQVDLKEITILNTVAHIKTRPVIKSGIFIKKKEVLENLKEKGVKITDIQ